MKNKREFIKDLNKNRITKLPFIEVFRKNKQLRKELFNQYLKTDLKPNLDLYVNKYFSDVEIQEGLIEANQNIPTFEVERISNTIVAANFINHSNFECRIMEIDREFYQKKIENSIDKKYYSHSISETVIFTRLTLVSTLVNDFKEKVLRKNDVGVIQSAIDIINSIIDNLKEIKIIELTKMVLNDIINDNENIILELTETNNSNDLKKDYAEIKRYADNKLKEYLKNIEIQNNEFENKALPPQPISVNESRTKKVIFETITNIDKQGWQYAFVSEQDYNLFTVLLTNFFEYKPYTLPETIIQLKRTCKTKVAKALGEIHKELSNENKLSTDTKYFKLIRVLSHFEKETEGDLYKALTR